MTNKEKIENLLKKPWVDRLRNKYLIVSVFFLIWIFFFDQNNLIERFKMMKEVNQLEDNKTYYIEETKRITDQYDDLTNKKENLERFAREKYYMKRDNEDVFVIVDD